MSREYIIFGLNSEYGTSMHIQLAHLLGIAWLSSEPLKPQEAKKCRRDLNPFTLPGQERQRQARKRKVPHVWLRVLDPKYVQNGHPSEGRPTIHSAALSFSPKRRPNICLFISRHLADSDDEAGVTALPSRGQRPYAGVRLLVQP